MAGREEILKLLHHDPVKYWSDQAKQLQSPYIFAANLVTLAYQSTSTFQERVFSTSGETVDRLRSRLYETPELLEAVVILRHVYAQEISFRKLSLKALREALEEADVVEDNDYG